MSFRRRAADVREAVRKRKVRAELLALLDTTSFQRATMLEREMVEERLAYYNVVPMEVRCR